MRAATTNVNALSLSKNELDDGSFDIKRKNNKSKKNVILEISCPNERARTEKSAKMEMIRKNRNDNSDLASDSNENAKLFRENSHQ